MKRLLMTVAMAASLCAVAAADWQQSYRSYAAAIEAGDDEAALRHAEEAWRSSSEALPAGENRALLAQNFIGLNYQADPEGTVPALLDAVALAEAGYGTGNIPLPTLRFLLAAAEAKAAPRNRRATEAAYQALGKVPDHELATPEVLVGHISLLDRLLHHDRIDETVEAADRLSTTLQQQGGPDSMIVFAEGYRAMATGNKRPSTESGLQSTKSRIPDREQKLFLDRLRDAIKANRRAQARYGVQDGIDSFDPGLAKLYAWELYLRAFAYSYLESYDRADFNRSLGRSPIAIRREGSCPAIKWRRRESRFPTSEVGYNGAVVYAYDLDEQGRTQGVRVLAEVPGPMFGEHTIDTVSKWRADVGKLNERCRSDFMQSHLFYTVADR